MFPLGDFSPAFPFESYWRILTLHLFTRLKPLNYSIHSGNSIESLDHRITTSECIPHAKSNTKRLSKSDICLLKEKCG